MNKLPFSSIICNSNKIAKTGNKIAYIQATFLFNHEPANLVFLSTCSIIITYTLTSGQRPSSIFCITY